MDGVLWELASFFGAEIGITVERAVMATLSNLRKKTFLNMEECPKTWTMSVQHAAHEILQSVNSSSAPAATSQSAELLKQIAELRAANAELRSANAELKEEVKVAKEELKDSKEELKDAKLEMKDLKEDLKEVKQISKMVSPTPMMSP